MVETPTATIGFLVVALDHLMEKAATTTTVKIEIQSPATAVPVPVVAAE
jgi:hypothetical protein